MSNGIRVSACECMDKGIHIEEENGKELHGKQRYNVHIPEFPFMVCICLRTNKGPEDPPLSSKSPAHSFMLPLF